MVCGRSLQVQCFVISTLSAQAPVAVVDLAARAASAARAAEVVLVFVQCGPQARSVTLRTLSSALVV